MLEKEYVPREWHVWDFPDNIMVYFNEEFRLRLYAKLKDICGTRDEIARKLESNKETIRSSLFLGERDGHKSYTFVKIVKKIVEVFGLQLDSDFLNEMDRNVVAYRSWNGWSVTNPLLPIKESPQLYSLVFHLIGDGNASKRHSPFYCGPDKELIEEFENYLQIFGDVEVRRKIRLFNGLIITYFPKAVADILSHIMRIGFTHPDSLPESIFNASPECKVSAIRAFIDDEGCVSSNFCVDQKSKRIISQFRQLLNSIGIECGKIGRNNTTGVHKLYIFKTSYKTFLKSVNLTHIKKREKLMELIKMDEFRTEQKIINQIQYKILDLLTEKYPLTKHDIARHLGIIVGSALDTLLNLKEKGKVIGKFTNKNKPYFWYPTVSNA